MHIFLSWSGPSSQALAEILRGWLPTVLPYARPWLSSEDIRKGKRWGVELAERLEQTSYCVVCVTEPAVARAPWVNFEAGAISKYIEDAHVSPLLVDVKPEDLGSLPLSMFQCTRFDKKDIGRLLKSMNTASGSPIENGDLKRNLRNAWKQLQEDVDGLDLADASQDSIDDYSNDDHNDEDILLSDIEERILKYVADNPDRYLEMEDVRDHVRENHIRVQHYLDCLVEDRLLHAHIGTEYPTTYVATEKGREYLVENDLV